MTISIQHIHSLLRTYNKQLKLASLNRNKKNTLPQSNKHNATISAEAKRKQIYQQAASNIMNKLITNGTLTSLFLNRNRKIN